MFGQLHVLHVIRNLPERAAVLAVWYVVYAMPFAVNAGNERVYANTLKPLGDPQPLLGDYPEFVQPIVETDRFEAPLLVDERDADLSVRAWRWSYNARGIVEVPNRLRGDRTALIIVHPWGIDDGQGWNTPQPAGVAFQCTPEKNQVCRKHVREVVNPLVQSMRSRVALVMYSLPGKQDPIRQKIYRSYGHRPTAEQRRRGQKLLEEKLADFEYRGQGVPAKITVSTETPTLNYFREFPGLDAGARYNGAGFWDLPIPVMSDIDVDPDDVVIYDAEGYDALREFLKSYGIRHILLAGYNTDMCVCSTTAGYENLRRDFDVFLVGDATLATFPASPIPALATTAAVSFASLNLLITQVSWIRPLDAKRCAGAKQPD